MGPLAINSSTLTAPGTSGLIPAVGRLSRRRLRRGTLAALGIAPERVHKNPDRSARRANVFDLARGQPIVNGAAAYAHQLARLHDRDCFSFHRQFASGKGYRSVGGPGIGIEGSGAVFIFCKTAPDPSTLDPCQYIGATL